MNQRLHQALSNPKIEEKPTTPNPYPLIRKEHAWNWDWISFSIQDAWVLVPWSTLVMT